MTPFLDGFADELEKLAIVKRVGKYVAKHPLKSLMYGALGYATYRGAREGVKKKRRIGATARGPSKAWYANMHKALGLPMRETKHQRYRRSFHFPRWREKA